MLVSEWPLSEKMNLPKEIVFQILLSLPVLSLLRFSSVCKDWYALIKSSVFKDNYLALRRDKAVDDQVVGLKLDHYDSGIVKCFVTSWYDDFKPLALCASSPPSSKVVEISGNRSGRMTMISHFDGIVYIQGGNRGNPWEDDIRENWFDITLVNPALREFIKLPVPDDVLGDYFGYDVFSGGFGCDDSTNDYKVFAIVNLCDMGFKLVALVYNLSSNSWRKLGLLSEIIPGHSDVYVSFYAAEVCIFIHGSFHWIMGYEPNYRILTFNLTTELFQLMLFPRSWTYDEQIIAARLLTIDKSTIALAAFSRYQDNSADVLDIWVMKEYGDRESWTKQYSLTPPHRIFEPLSFWKKDKLVIVTVEDYRLICYDLFTDQVYEYQDFDPIYGSYDLSAGQLPTCWPYGWGLQFVTGHESFVSLKKD